MRTLLVSALALLLSSTAVTAQEPYKNPNLAPAQRAADLVRRLSLKEKIALMQNQSPAIDRLDIPAFPWWNEALHGVGRNGLATVYPVTIGMAASFDDKLLQQCFTDVSDEARAKNTEARRSGKLRQYAGLSFWTPNINIFRDPRWGRGQETYGEDPYLTSVMGLAVVRGLQGPVHARYAKTLACAKHFAVHSGPEWSRHSFDIESLPARDLWETYLPAFKTLVEEGQVAEVMCAYHSMDGKPCCGNSRYLQQILRDEWHFKGLVTSDCGAINDFFSPHGHHYTSTAYEASAKAVLAGTDVECGNSFSSLYEAVEKGEISESRLDTSLCRLLEARFRLGDFDADSLVAWTQIPMRVVASEEHHAHALQMALESMTLLQNRGGLLPLRPGQRIVVLGENAVADTAMWGNYNGFPRSTVTILGGIRRRAPQAVYLPGFNLMSQQASVDNGYIKNADVVVFVGGISPRLEGEEMPVGLPGFRGGDRTSIELPYAQRKVIGLLHDMGKKVVLINCSGSAVGLEPETHHADAILQAWYGGEAAGEAVAQVLFGEFNPCGKLPVTFYRNTEQLPDYEDYRMQGRTYRYLQSKPLFPFGFGLSYTTFSISKPSYVNGKVNVTVRSTGKRLGTEVVQIYLRRLDDEGGPIRTLRGFCRVTLQPGQKRGVSIDLPRKNLSTWDAATNTMRFVPGTYVISAGSSSAGDDLKSVKVTLR